jgi:lipopolysaccharide/colanic/teichoic acid biosynthesis glycosyltransferase
MGGNFFFLGMLFMEEKNQSAILLSYKQAERVVRVNFYARKLKRPVETLLSLGLLLLFGPLMLAIALGIRLYSPGPILYRQQRIGKDGKAFTMLKFRSMRLENSPDLHREHVQRLIRDNVDLKEFGVGSLKLKSDPRITGLGKILRKLSLDELPQLFNVLKGEMALVGPRPPLPYEYEVYFDWHKQRLAVLPGITGLWQVLARNTCCFDDMVILDIKYIETMSLWNDLKIMIMTPVEMIKGKGSG